MSNELFVLLGGAGLFLGIAGRGWFRWSNARRVRDEWSYTSGTLGWFDKDEDGTRWFTFGDPPETEEELAAARERRFSPIHDPSQGGTE